MHKIFIITDSVYPDDSGGRKLSLGRIIQANEQGYKVTVILYNLTQSDPVLATQFFNSKNIEFICYEPKHKRNSRLKRFIKYIASTFGFLPEAYTYIKKDSCFKYFVKQVINKYPDSLIALENIFLFGLVDEIPKVKMNELVFHNVESRFYLELASASSDIARKIYYGLEGVKLGVLEKIIFGKYINTFKFIFLTKEDFLYYKECHKVSNFDYLINKNTLYLPFNIVRNVNITNPFFLFPGGLAFPPNRQGIEWLLNSIECVGFDILITGKYSSELLSSFSNYKNVRLVGYVSNQELNKLYNECIAVISPIVTGGGIKIKNLEAVSLGIPLIATEFSMIGINDAEQCFVSKNNPLDFYSKMLEVIELMKK